MDESVWLTFSTVVVSLDMCVASAKDIAAAATYIFSEILTSLVPAYDNHVRICQRKRGTFSRLIRNSVTMNKVHGVKISFAFLEQRLPSVGFDLSLHF